AKIPEYKRIIRDNSLRTIASMLYEASQEEIIDAQVDSRFSYNGLVTRSYVRFANGDSKRFYFKRSHSPMGEALCMALINYIQGNRYKFIVDPNTKVLVTDEIPGDVLGAIDSWHPYYEMTAPSTIRSYAIALELSNFLGLGDRHLNNVLLTLDGDVVNIDFEPCFCFNTHNVDFFRKPLGHEAIKAVEISRKQARKDIKQTVKRNSLLLAHIIKCAENIEEAINGCHRPMSIGGGRTWRTMNHYLDQA
ncbi:MAG: hypothetical protein V1906_00120, partial [Candidatus Woesearchaeota archaeon]